MEGVPYPMMKQGQCPRCGGELRDMRGVAFNHGAMEADGVCFQWSDNDFTCSRRTGLGRAEEIQAPKR